MTTVSELIRGHHADILATWQQHAQDAASARGLSAPEMRNLMPEYLSALAAAGPELAGVTERRRLVESHVASRTRLGFHLAEIAHEFALLGRAISSVWAGRSAGEQPSTADVEQLYSELHLATTAVSDLFIRHMLEDEQTEKRYARLVETVARDALDPGAPPLRRRLREVLEVLLDAMGGRAAALFWNDPKHGGLVVIATAGAGADIEKRADLAALPRVGAAYLDVGPEWRGAGVQSLLGVRLFPRRRLMGALYVGMAGTSSLGAREVSRLELLAERLALHLDNAELFAELGRNVERLNHERALREGFVSMLAHDLRGPLGTATAWSHLLAERQGVDRKREAAATIARNLDRVDRMIVDMLDANQILSGRRVELDLRDCDLTTIAHEVAGDMARVHGERFVVTADPHVRGIWSAEELRRVLWNLASNAVKHGAPEGQVSIGVLRDGDDGVIAWVHNEGAPILRGDQAHLFEPFSRGTALGSRPEGWGLGLAVVRLCTEAHGGSIHVESTAEAGTTFTLRLPWDSRSYQDAADLAMAD
jgi:signal transduction histidine kinase